MSDTKRAANCVECMHWASDGECLAPIPDWAERLTDYGVFQWRDKVMMESGGTDCPVSQKKEAEG